MKNILARLLLLVMLQSACVVAASAQTAAPLDAAAAKAQLSQEAKKPRFTPKGLVKSRTYKLNAKGAGVEIIEYQPATPGAEPERVEHPYFAVPILFVVGKDALLDSVSRENVEKTAAILKEIMISDPKAKFIIQGHTSAEGDKGTNQTLSEKRANKIFDLLTNGQGVEASKLDRIGFGADYATASASAPESDLQRDRRVLVVRQ